MLPFHRLCQPYYDPNGFKANAAFSDRTSLQNVFLFLANSDYHIVMCLKIAFKVHFLYLIWGKLPQNVQCFVFWEGSWFSLSVHGIRHLPPDCIYALFLSWRAFIKHSSVRAMDNIHVLNKKQIANNMQTGSMSFIQYLKIIFSWLGK